mmetsp:Transcript_16707/g.35457  ORF Transcript_16707/g.35457 Transcript_16707/m.35457 type:complete len:321 (-) Transcript_16707:948-1910(-)
MNATGSPVCRSTWIRSQSSSKVFTLWPATFTIASPTSKPHLAPGACTRITNVSCSSKPNGLVWGSSPTMMRFTGGFFRVLSSSGLLRTIWKEPSLSIFSSIFSLTTMTGPVSNRLRCIHSPKIVPPRQQGTKKRSHTQEPWGNRKLMLERMPSSSAPVPMAAGGSVVVVVLVSKKNSGSAWRIGEHERGVHMPTSPQQNSVSPEQSVSHITGCSNGHWPRPRWFSQQAQPSSCMLQRCPSMHCKTLLSPLCRFQGHASDPEWLASSGRYGRDKAAHSRALGNSKSKHCCCMRFCSKTRQSSDSQRTGTPEPLTPWRPKTR